MLTRKHYQELADILKSQPENERKEDLIARLADMLEEDNPNFCKEKFLSACQGE